MYLGKFDIDKNYEVGIRIETLGDRLRRIIGDEDFNFYFQKWPYYFKTKKDAQRFLKHLYNATKSELTEKYGARVAVMDYNINPSDTVIMYLYYGAGAFVDPSKTLAKVTFAVHEIDVYSYKDEG